MASLYEIDQRLLNLQYYGVDSETGEVAVDEDDFQRIFEEIHMDMETKFVNTACFIKNLRSDVEDFKTEIARLEKRKKAKENLANRLEKSMDTIIKHHLFNIEDPEDFEKIHQWNIDKTQAKITFRPSQKLEIYDEALVPDDYKTTVETVKVDMKAITADIKNGVEVNGAQLVSNLNIQIK